MYYLQIISLFHFHSLERKAKNYFAEFPISTFKIIYFFPTQYSRKIRPIKRLSRTSIDGELSKKTGFLISYNTTGLHGLGTPGRLIQTPVIPSATTGKKKCITSFTITSIAVGLLAFPTVTWPSH